MKGGKFKPRTRGRWSLKSGIGGFLDGLSCLVKYEEPYCRLTQEEAEEMKRYVDELFKED